MKFPTTVDWNEDDNSLYVLDQTNLAIRRLTQGRVEMVSDRTGLTVSQRDSPSEKFLTDGRGLETGLQDTSLVELRENGLYGIDKKNDASEAVLAPFVKPSGVIPDVITDMQMAGGRIFATRIKGDIVAMNIREEHIRVLNCLGPSYKKMYFL